MNEFEKYRKNVTSQYGEDGIIEELFNRLGVNNPTCIEFGAWDGKYLSNVWNLWNNKGWSALLIEGEGDRAKSLVEAVKPFQKVRVVNTFVMPQGDQSLDEIAKRNNIDSKVDLLSIDIDGNDYHILNGLESLKPRVIIIEYNPTIPPHLEIVQKPGEFFGASAKAILNLGHKKNYKLAAITDTNLFFVQADEFGKLNIDELDLEKVFPGNHLTYVYSSYDGRLFLDKKPPYLYEMDSIADFANRKSSLRSSVKRILKGKKSNEMSVHPDIDSESQIIEVHLFKG